MEVAVTDMAVHEGPRLGIHAADCLSNLHIELTNAADRHRHVELVRHAGGIHRLGVTLTKLPEPMSTRLVRSHHRVA